MQTTSADGPPADLSNWTLPPFNHWAFQHVRQIMPVADIPAGPGPALPLPPSRRSLDGFSLPWRNGTMSLAAVLEASATDGMVVLKDGELVFEAYGHGMTAETVHIVMSATKAVVGLTAGILQARGVLDLDAPISRHVPEIAPTAFAGATLRNLLDMRTGVRFDDRRQLAYGEAGGWEPRGPGAPGGLHDFLANLDAPHRPHGETFAYVSANTDLLGWAIERAAGEPIAALISRLLWAPMGAERGACITLDPQGAPRCTGGFCATVRDFARLGQLVLQGGRRDGAEIVPSAVIEDIAGNGDPQAWAKGEWGKVFGFTGGPMRYRSGWYIVDSDPQLLFAMGIHGQNLFVDRANRIVVAKLSSQASRIDYDAVPMTHRMVSQIQRLLG